MQKLENDLKNIFNQTLTEKFGIKSGTQYRPLWINKAVSPHICRHCRKKIEKENNYASAYLPYLTTFDEMIGYEYHKFCSISCFVEYMKANYKKLLDIKFPQCKEARKAELNLDIAIQLMQWLKDEYGFGK